MLHKTNKQTKIFPALTNIGANSSWLPIIRSTVTGSEIAISLKSQQYHSLGVLPDHEMRRTNWFREIKGRSPPTCTPLPIIERATITEWRQDPWKGGVIKRASALGVHWSCLYSCKFAVYFLKWRHFFPKSNDRETYSDCKTWKNQYVSHSPQLSGPWESKVWLWLGQR